MRKILLSLFLCLSSLNAQPPHFMPFREAVEALLIFPSTTHIGRLFCDQKNYTVPHKPPAISAERYALLQAMTDKITQEKQFPANVSDACVSLLAAYTESFQQLTRGGDFNLNEMNVSANALRLLLRRGQEENKKRTSVKYQEYLRQKRLEKDAKIKRKQQERMERAAQHNRKRHEHMLATNQKRERERRRQASKELRKEKRNKTREDEKFKLEQAQLEAQRRAKEAMEQAKRDHIREQLAKKRRQ